MIKTIGLIAASILPLWNIPLIMRIQRRRSSQDISLAWALGVMVCLIVMLPSAFISSEIVYKAFSFVNFVFFSAVVVQILRFRC